jgi:predicted metal-dependent phosphotriesterase family hydrolase
MAGRNSTKQKSMRIQTVQGGVPPEKAGITDAHNHLWIEPVVPDAPDLPCLNNPTAIKRELQNYYEAGGGMILDCQPGGCGRNATALSNLAAATGISIVACTGRHLSKYYPKDSWQVKAGVDELVGYFIEEINKGVREIPAEPDRPRAGFVKVACEAELALSSKANIEASALASKETGACIQVHTEHGRVAEQILSFFLRCGGDPNRLVLCHMDKRPDLSLHRELARAGILLEYDTFYRSKYEPERNVWPLLEKMIAIDLGSQIVLGTDMADFSFWTTMGFGPGLPGFLTCIVRRLQRLGMPGPIIAKLAGDNIANRLALESYP